MGPGFDSWMQSKEFWCNNCADEVTTYYIIIDNIKCYLCKECKSKKELNNEQT